LAAFQSYIDANIEEDVWRKILKPVAGDCLNTLMINWREREMKIESSPFNLKKSDCSPLAMSFNTCITLEAFKVNNLNCFKLLNDYGHCRDALKRSGLMTRSA
jgi:hypothetical protein